MSRQNGGVDVQCLGSFHVHVDTYIHAHCQLRSQQAGHRHTCWSSCTWFGCVGLLHVLSLALFPSAAQLQWSTSRPGPLPQKAAQALKAPAELADALRALPCVVLCCFVLQKSDVVCFVDHAGQSLGCAEFVWASTFLACCVAVSHTFAHSLSAGLHQPQLHTDCVPAL